MDAHRRVVRRADGTRIGLVTAGEGPPLLLVHGGMCSAARWAPLWPLLAERFEVTAMDRRGRGSSTDGVAYSIDEEYADVAAVVRELAAGAGGPVDVFGHSYGAVCALGAAAGGAAVRRLVLYEPPGPATVPVDWLERVRRLIADGQVGQAMGSFLIEVVGLSPAEVDELAAAAGSRRRAEVAVPAPDSVADLDSPDAAIGDDPLVIAGRTMVREAEALSIVDLPGLAVEVDRPVLLLLGTESPAWAQQNTEALLAVLPSTTLARLAGRGHEAVDTAPAVVARLVAQFLREPDRWGG